MYISRSTLELIKVEHQKVVHRLADQRSIVRQAIDSGGGTHDNAMYDAALNEQQVLAQRELQLRDYLAHTIVEDLAVRADKVALGTRVQLSRNDNGKTEEYVILGPADAEFASSDFVVSYLSPLAKQLIGAEVGETVRVSVPSGVYDATVIGIEKALT